ncbi:hypothetical protein A0H81_07249 [Grifola frondosa]|uniref:Uncharacterized protein n=1 Tax=Grifola frondosa TaxID=5627 RepID=A0A1C7M835_GRIFR|nr:hypothetical protein A0H81_07249 [Grifola frondosa]
MSWMLGPFREGLTPYVVQEPSSLVSCSPWATATAIVARARDGRDQIIGIERPTTLRRDAPILVTLKSGSFESLAASWITCSSTTEPLSKRSSPRELCSFKRDLCRGTYFENAVPVIDMRLAKQGFRLAAWLNVSFDGATDLL